MAFITLKCPSCRADIQLDNSKEFGFCSFCGTKIIQDKQVVEHRIINNYENEISGFVALAERYYEKGEYNIAEVYYEKVIALDPKNVIANEKLKQIDNIVQTENIFIKRVSSIIDASCKFHVVIDEQVVAKLSPLQCLKKSISIGDHVIKVDGFQKSTPLCFKVNNNKEKLYFIIKNSFGCSKIKQVSESEFNKN